MKTFFFCLKRGQNNFLIHTPFWKQVSAANLRTHSKDVNKQKKLFWKYYGKCSKVRTLVACQKGLDKLCRPRSDSFWRSSLIRAFPVCHSAKHFINSSPDNQHFIWEQKEKSVQKFRTFTLINTNVTQNSPYCTSHQGIDPFHIVSVHAPNCLVLRYLPEITFEGGTFIRLPIHYTVEWCTDISATDISATNVSAWTFRPWTFRPWTFRPGHFGHGRFGHGKCQRWTFPP